MFKKIVGIIKDILYGMTTYKDVVELRKKAFQSECLLMAVTLGDMLGVPTQSYYRLRLLPYWARKVERFKNEILREKDILEKEAAFEVE